MSDNGYDVKRGSANVYCIQSLYVYILLLYYTNSKQHCCINGIFILMNTVLIFSPVFLHDNRLKYNKTLSHVH